MASITALAEVLPASGFTSLVALSAAVCATDAEGRVTHFNRAAAGLIAAIRRLGKRR
ncbi:MAG: hypothetical protein L6R19_03020 [Alphaproteobacteria bacterium]|nr:hypothetical protein [Alphaproteobacteria bacterium]